MSLKRYRYGPLKVSVKDAGEELQPWGREVRLAYKYEVTVVAPNGTTYTAPAWGSAHEHELGSRDRRAIARMTVDELYSALSDPDEWLDVVIGDAKGREAYERGKTAERVIETARKMGETEIGQGGHASFLEEDEGVSPKEWSPDTGEDD